MDEPQVTSPVEDIEPDAEKPAANEVLDSAFVSGELEKPMDVDEVNLDDEPSTSTEITSPDDAGTSVEHAKDSLEPAELDADQPHDISMSEEISDEHPSQSVEQVIFDKPDTELDEIAQSGIENDTLDFTERSINISQLDVEHHDDDSNDAFNALKESETDALQTPKEENDPKELEENTEPEQETLAESKCPEKEDTEPSESVETQMETDEVEDSADKEDEATTIADPTIEENHEVGAEVGAEIDDNESLGRPESVEKPENEEVEEIPDDDGTTETTNEGEGIDENVCLLGDETECVVSEADKENAAQTDDVADDEESELTLEKEVSAEPEVPEDVIEVDPEAADKEPDETEPTEAEEEDEATVESSVPLKENEIREVSGEATEQSCLNCENSIICLYQVLEDSGKVQYLCTLNCVKEHREDNPDKYTLVQKKVFIHEISPLEQPCSKCGETKDCKFRYRVTTSSTITKDPPALSEGEKAPEEPPQPITETIQTTESKYLCDDSCLKDFIGNNTEKYVVKEVKRRSERTREPPSRHQAEEEQEVPKIVARSDAEVEAARVDRDQSFMRRCNQCFEIVNFGEKTMQWETYDFCDEKCLGLYQNLIGAACAQCNEVVSLASIGKLCVRFGPEVKQFCTSQCLNDFKKTHQPCSLCSQNLRKDDGEEIVTGKRGNNFCDETCSKQYEDIVNPKKKQPPYLCSVCNNKKSPKVQVILDGNVHRFCSNPCFSAFKFVNNVVPDQCDMCTKYFERKSSDAHTIYQGNSPKIFCTRICMSIFITKSREILQCNWCKVSKYSFDMVLFNFGKNRMCSLNCLSLYEVSVNALSKKRSKCDQCKMQKQPQYHLTMSDTSIRNFCTYQCVLGFQSQFSKSRIASDSPSVVPAGTAKRIKPASVNLQAKQPVPVISLVQSLSTRRGRQPYNPTNRRGGSPIPVPELTVQLERLSDLPARVKVSSLSSLTGGSSSWTPISPGAPAARVEHKTQVVTIPPLPKQVGNKSTMCKAITLNKAISCIPSTAEAECQTDDWLEQRVVVPVPIPIFIPQPMYMYNLPTPIPVPIPLPIPVPVFVPTTRNSASGIMKEIKKIQEKMPTDPYEAELLMMAEMVAGDKKREETDSDSDENNEIEYGDGIENNSAFNEDLVQMAFKMASGNDFDDPPVDLENEMTANTISQSSNAYGDDMDSHSLQHHQLLLLQQQRDAAAAAAMQSNRGRKRIQPPVKQTNNRNSAPNKRIKREMEVMQPEMPREPAEKPDANMCLKYTFGVNAWKQWVATKNADFEKSSIRRKPIKSEILQLTADELNYSLCMFVKEVRKPNGSEYAPDTIYYLVLGIQQYLYENGRIDNIFTDRYYEQFTDCLDEVAKKFSVLYNDSQYIVTRVEEEHLWECKQLGAHSPHVLLSTLMFFNTKHFNLVTVDEHMELSFSHIMKHWKRNPNQPGAAKVPGSRNVLLRFYPPQSSLEANSRKKKVYEQQENEENPLRCPVKLYEFYLSKCPESVKTRNDVFYLQPERSCVPDSPVWYSTQPLSRDALSKMLHRVKMVKEINIALLTS